MTQRAAAAAIALAFCIGGCARNAGLRCENQARYEGAEEAAALVIPDDLDPPGEAESLRIPAADGATAAGESQAPGQQSEQDGDTASCTEAPPDFFQEGSPG